MGDGFIGEITDLLVLREVTSIDTVIHDFYTNRLSVNYPCDVLNQNYYGERLLFYLHPLRMTESSIINPFLDVSVKATDKVMFSQYSTPLQSLLQVGGLSRVLSLIQFFVHTKNTSDF